MNEDRKGAKFRDDWPIDWRELLACSAEEKVDKKSWNDEVVLHG